MVGMFWKTNREKRGEENFFLGLEKKHSFKKIALVMACTFFVGRVMKRRILEPFLISLIES